MNCSYSKYTAEERDQFAAACYKLVQSGTTTVSEYAKENGLDRKILYNWMVGRYGYRTRGNNGSAAEPAQFVKVKPAASIRNGCRIEIEYHGAKIKVAGDDDLRRVLQVLREVAI